MTPPDRDQASREKGKVAWERPTLTLLGDVKDLIHASGKAGAHADSDSARPGKSLPGLMGQVRLSSSIAPRLEIVAARQEPPSRAAGARTPRCGAMLRAG